MRIPSTTYYCSNPMEERNKRILLRYMKTLYTGLDDHNKWFLLQDLHGFLGSTGHYMKQINKQQKEFRDLLGSMSYEDLVTYWGKKSRSSAAGFPVIH